LKYLSVIIPVYNRKKEVVALLKSLFSQKYPKNAVEFIVVDDGSTDGIKKEILPLLKKHKELRCIRRNNAGPAAARNTGIKKSKGSVIGFIDSDVIAGRNLIVNLLKAFRENPTADGIEGITVKKEGPVPQTLFTHYAENTKPGRWLTCNLYIKKKALLKAGLFDERYRNPMREDTDLGFALIRSGAKIIFSKSVKIIHPVYKGNYRQLLKSAYYGIYEALLFRKYPREYFKNLKWIDGWFFPVYYSGYYTLPFFFGFYLLYNNSFILYSGLFLFLASYITTIYALFRKKRFRIRDLIIAGFFSLFTPYLRLFWVIAGFIKFRKI